MSMVQSGFSSIKMISKFEENPMMYITANKGKYEFAYRYSYLKKQCYVYLGTYENIIDAMRERDLFVKRWFGIDIGDISNEYINKEKQKYEKLGCFWLKNGFLYDDKFNRIIFRNKRAQINVKSKIIKKITLTMDDVFNLVNGKSFVIENKYFCYYQDNNINVDRFCNKKHSKHNILKRKYRDRVFIQAERKYFGTYKQTKADSYSSVFIYKRKKYHIANFSNPIESELMYFDFYYFFHGEKHKGDRR